MCPILDNLDDSNLQILSSFPSDYKIYYDGWDKVYKDKFKGHLKKINDKTLVEIAKYYQIDEKLERSNIEDLISRDVEIGSVLLTIYEFAKDKTTLIKEYNRLKGIDKQIEDVFDYFFEIYSKDKGELLNIYIFSEWTKHASINTFAIEGKFPDSIIESISSAERKIVYNLKRKTNAGKKGYIFKYRGYVQFPNQIIFMFCKQTNDAEKEDVIGIQRRRDLHPFFVCIDKQTKDLIIKETSLDVRDMLILQVGRALEIKVKNKEIGKNVYSLTKFNEAIFSSKKDTDIQILTISFRETNLLPPVPLTISRKTFGIDISPVLEDLKDKIGSLQEDILRVQDMWIRYKNLERKISITEQEDMSILLKFDESQLPDARIKEIKNKFEMQFGIPLNQPLPPYSIAKNMDKLIDYLLNCPDTKRFRPFHYDELKKLETGGIVEISQKEGYICGACQEVFRDLSITDCPECGSKLLNKFDYGDNIKINEDGVIDYLSELLKKEGITVHSKNSIKWVKNTKVRLIETSIQDGKAYFYISKGAPKSVIEYFQENYMPVVIVHVGSPKNYDLINEKHFSQIKLSDIYCQVIQEKIKSDFFSEKIKEQIRYQYGQILNNAKLGYTQLVEIHKNPVKQLWGDFEKSIFFVLKQIIPNSDQWGIKKSSKRLPDGLGTFSFTKDDKLHIRSMGWDCKLTEGNALDLTNETDKLRAYIHRLINSKQLKSQCSDLHFFVIITNEPNADKFKPVAKALNKMTKWNGKIILFSSKALLHLHKLYNDNSLKIIQNHDIFFINFLYMLNNQKFQVKRGKEDEFILVDDKLIDKLFNEFEKEAKHKPISIEPIRKHMESDRFD